MLALNFCHQHGHSFSSQLHDQQSHINNCWRLEHHLHSFSVCWIWSRHFLNISNKKQLFPIKGTLQLWILLVALYCLHEISKRPNTLKYNEQDCERERIRQVLRCILILKWLKKYWSLRYWPLNGIHPPIMNRSTEFDLLH